jgi:hypothetical protein
MNYRLDLSLENQKVMLQLYNYKDLNLYFILSMKTFLFLKKLEGLDHNLYSYCNTNFNKLVKTSFFVYGNTQILVINSKPIGI